MKVVRVTDEINGSVGCRIGVEEQSTKLGRSKDSDEGIAIS
jgi:hypothetical protein